jgi:hypothetical protein
MEPVEVTAIELLTRTRFDEMRDDAMHNKGDGRLPKSTKTPASAGKPDEEEGEPLPWCAEFGQAVTAALNGYGHNNNYVSAMEVAYLLSVRGYCSVYSQEKNRLLVWLEGEKTLQNGDGTRDKVLVRTSATHAEISELFGVRFPVYRYMRASA